ncbi:hypothetical protein NDU88_011282 [Pleurodeles waltl]|uniref:Uncharacterized protein n=1 Tax=Pleurodeles waltl TaxID=8319 RepID=A0AAV7Q065_PLEWA|nr:hypothetical protein NDU88_011282 [Pleurodeles waltl]
MMSRHSALSTQGAGTAGGGSITRHDEQTLRSEYSGGRDGRRGQYYPSRYVRIVCIQRLSLTQALSHLCSEACRNMGFIEQLEITRIDRTEALGVVTSSPSYRLLLLI